MRAINHALTGTAIGLLVGEPLIALPAALASHFVCDSIPHHGSQNPNPKVLKSRLFAQTLVLDAVLCGLLVGLLAFSQPLHWQLAAVCAFLAASPDFLYIPRFLGARANKDEYKPNPLVRFTINIQWFQRPIGWLVEVAWLVAGIAVVLPFVR